MSLTGGKRKVNKSLKAWVAFVKKVQKEEKLSYKDAIHRAKVRKDKGEKWMMGGATEVYEEEEVDMGTTTTSTPISGGRRRRKSMRGGEEAVVDDMEVTNMSGMVDGMNNVDVMEDEQQGGVVFGGRRRHRTMRRSKGRSRGRGRTMRRSKGRSRGRGRSQKGGITLL